MKDRTIRPRETRLTRQEKVIVRLLHQGLTNHEIARQAAISVETVKRHLYNIFDKIGCSTRLELVTMTLHDSPDIVALREELAAVATAKAASEARLQAEKDEIERDLRKELAMAHRLIETFGKQAR